ncbi:MAG: ATP-binding protein [Fuerstiella sp.]
MSYWCLPAGLGKLMHSKIRSANSTRTSILLSLLGTPWRVLGLMLIVVFAVEAVVMLLLPSLLPRGISDAMAAVIDAALLTAISAPALWWIIIAPLRRIALEAQALSSTIVEHAGDGIVTVGADGRVRTCNPAALMLFERKSEEVLGRPVTKLLPGISLASTGVGEAVSINARRRSGTEFPASVSIRHLGGQDASASVIVVRDLTEARRGEQERTLAARQQEAMRASQMATLAQLATGVAHEIRNPLTAIKMLVQSTRSTGVDSEWSGEDLKIVEDQIRRMEQSVNALLDFARPAPVERRQLSPGDMLPAVVRLLEGQAAKQSVRIRTDVRRPDLRLNADHDQLQQLLLNLGLNALNAMPAGGTLSFSVDSHQPDMVCIQVMDTGPGISPEVIDHVFDPFFTTRKQGIGLGLNICRRIAEEHGGTLMARNSPTGGAVFELCVPCLNTTDVESESVNAATTGD